MKVKKNIVQVILLLTIYWTAPIDAEKLKVVTTYPWIASITKEIGSDLIQVQSLANSKWDPHTIVPRPSYIAKLRDASLLITNGAELEIGWLPPLLSQANNMKVTGQGILILSNFVKLIEIPKNLSRAQGDVHPEGNPHFLLNPDNIIPVAQAICERLAVLDSDHSKEYRLNLENFMKRWRQNLTKWDSQMNKLKGKPVVQYHKIFHYFIMRYGMIEEGTLERLPGIPPTPQHLGNLEKNMRNKYVQIILQDVYNPDEASKMLARNMNLKLIYLPHDVGAVPEAKDIFALFDEIVKRLTNE